MNDTAITHNIVVIGPHDSCEGCAAIHNQDLCRVLMESCADHQRSDGVEVIYKQHYRLSNKELIY